MTGITKEEEAASTAVLRKARRYPNTDDSGEVEKRE